MVSSIAVLQRRGTPHSPKLQGWSVTVICILVSYIRSLIWQWVLSYCAYSTSLANKAHIYIYIYIVCDISKYRVLNISDRADISKFWLNWQQSLIWWLHTGESDSHQVPLTQSKLREILRFLKSKKCSIRACWVGLGWFLWYINHCRLFNAKYCFQRY